MLKSNKIYVMLCFVVLCYNNSHIFLFIFSFVWNIQHIVPLCFMLSWVYPVAMLVQRIVYEKEQRLKEVLNNIKKMNDLIVFN